MEELAKKCQQQGWFLKVNSQWTKALYAHNTQGSMKYDMCFQALRSMMMPEQTSFVDNVSAAEVYLRRQVLKHVLGDDYKQDMKKDVFPGPMAMQLCRRDLRLLSENDYWITEKSDGIRAMLFNHYIEDFPRWRRWRVKEQPSYRTLSLYDNLRVEAVYQDAQRNGRLHSEVKISNRQYKFLIKDSKLVDTQTGEQFFIKRDTGWSLTYLFDRKFEFYLCFEQFTFVTYEFKDGLKQKKNVKYNCQPVVVLDGEIIYNLRDKRYNYTVYDVCCCSDKAGQTVNYCKRDMTERMAAIKFVSECHHFFNKALLPQGTEPRSLQILPKHFYKKAQFETVRSCIKPSTTEKNKFLYKDYNLNDGLVFTPNSDELYPFAQGSNPYLLKWKWPSKLTADFLIVPVKPQNDERIFHFYFWIRSSAVFYRSMQIHPNTDPAILQRLADLEPPEGKIVECSLHLPKHLEFHPVGDSDVNCLDFVMNEPPLWEVECIRDDKNHANGFKVIANTLENVIEDITEDELRYYLLGVNTKPTKSVLLKQDESIQREFERRLIEASCLAHFKVVAHHADPSKFYVSFSTTISSQKGSSTHWNYYFELKNCLYAYPDVQESLSDILREKELPETYVRCLFVPQEGCWKIFDLDGDASRGSGSHLLRVLEYMVFLNAKILSEAEEETQSKRQREDEEDNDGFNSAYGNSNKRAKLEEESDPYYY